MSNMSGDDAVKRAETLFLNINKIVGDIPLYGESGAQMDVFCKKLAVDINDYCLQQGGFFIEEMGDKLTVKDSLVDLNEHPVYEKFAELMKSHFIVKIDFSAGVEEGEIKKLVHILGLKPVMISKESVEEEINNAGFKHIKMNEQSSIELVMDGGFSVGETDDSAGKTTRVDKILVVEDNDKLREMYREELVERGYNVRLACNGMEAMQKISSADPPDLMILDVKMAGMSGVEVLEQMKQKKFFIPVIIATAYPAMKDEVTIKTFPNLEVIIKPFSHDNLSKLINKMIDK